MKFVLVILECCFCEYLKEKTVFTHSHNEGLDWHEGKIENCENEVCKAGQRGEESK